MQFLRTLFWVVLAVVAVILALNNWTQVTVVLWGGMRVDTKLPVLLFAAFLVGLLPLLVVHRATRWSLRRRLDNAERALADLRGLVPLPPAVEPATPLAAVPSAGTPAAR